MLASSSLSVALVVWTRVYFIKGGSLKEATAYYFGSEG